MDSILGFGDCACVCGLVCVNAITCGSTLSVCVCMFDLSEEWRPFVFVCATLADNEHCDQDLVCRLLRARVCACVCVVSLCWDN